MTTHAASVVSQPPEPAVWSKRSSEPTRDEGCQALQEAEE
jgi:hypothetical protein